MATAQDRSRHRRKYQRRRRLVAMLRMIAHDCADSQVWRNRRKAQFRAEHSMARASETEKAQLGASGTEKARMGASGTEKAKLGICTGARRARFGY